MPSKALYTLLLIILLAVAVRFSTIGVESVTGDEMFSRYIALLPANDSLAAIRLDLVHPPLYYFLLKAGVSLWGAGVLGIRIISVFFGLATVLLAAAVGRSLSDRWSTGIFAAALIAVNQYLVMYSQQARSYAFYTFLVLLLVLWVSRVTKRGEEPSAGLWVAGCLLMVLLIYTHYVAALYIFFAVVAVVACNVPLKIKCLALLTSALAALSFTPWLAAVAEIYRGKGGVGQNLDWQGHPELYDLKMTWASGIGVPGFRGATTVAVLLVALLSFAALNLSSRGKPLRDSPLLLAVALLALFPPAALYLLSVKPFSLPLFGLRHLLPSIALLPLLCSYGLEILAKRQTKPELFHAAGKVLLLSLAAIPLSDNILHAPVNIPYHDMARAVRAQQAMGRQIYTTWHYGMAVPINFYCGAPVVSAMPADGKNLPEQIVLLYRPGNRKEVQVLNALCRNGYKVAASRSGAKPGRVAMMAHLARPASYLKAGGP